MGAGWGSNSSNQTLITCEGGNWSLRNICHTYQSCLGSRWYRYVFRITIWANSIDHGGSRWRRMVMLISLVFEDECEGIVTLIGLRIF